MTMLALFRVTFSMVETGIYMMGVSLYAHFEVLYWHFSVVKQETFQKNKQN